MSASTLINRYGKDFAVRRYGSGSLAANGEWMPGAEVFLPLANQVQVLVFSAVPDAGALQLAFGDDVAAAVTVPGALGEGSNLADWAAALTAALEALGSIGAGNVVLAAAIVEAQLQLTATFGGAMANAPQAELTPADNTLTAAGEASYLYTSEITVPGVAANTRMTARISLQTVGGKEAQLLAEGDRTKDSRKGYTTTALRTLNEQAKTAADRIEADDRLWEVRRVDPFPSETRLPHYRVLAIMVEDDKEE